MRPRRVVTPQPRAAGVKLPQFSNGTFDSDAADGGQTLCSSVDRSDAIVSFNLLDENCISTSRSCIVKPNHARKSKSKTG